MMGWGLASDQTSPMLVLVRMSREVLLGVASFCAACGPGQDLVLAIPDLELALIYTETAGGAVVAEVVRSADLPFRESLLDDAALVAVVHVDLSRLAGRLPDLEFDRAGETFTRIGVPSPDPGLNEEIDGRVFRPVSIPDDAETWAAHLGGGGGDGFTVDQAILGQVRRNVSLMVPTSRESCPSPMGPLRTFADVPDAYVIGARRIAPDRILLNGVRRLAVVRRGGELIDSISAIDQVPGGEFAQFSGMELDPRPGPGGLQHVWAATCSSVGDIDRTCVDGTARLLEFEVGPEGFGEVRTTTVMASGSGLLGLTSDGVGRLLIVRGATSFSLLEGEPPILVPFPAPEVASASRRPDRVVRTEDPLHPFLVGYKSSVSLLDWAERQWQTWVVTDTEVVSSYALDSAVDPSSGELEIWTGGNRGRLFRRLPGEPSFSRIDPFFPLALSPCANAERHAKDDYGDAYLDGDAAYLILATCSAAVRVRRGDLCASTLIEPGLVPEVSITHPMRVMSLDRGFVSMLRRLEQGTRIYELPVGDP